MAFTESTVEEAVQEWAEELGYAIQPKVLLLNADFGGVRSDL